PLVSTYDSDLLSALPAGDNIFTLLETTSAETISTRISTGGLDFGSAAGLSGFGGSVTQTRYRIDDVDITAPSSGGAPMAVPELFFWRRVAVSSGGIGPGGDGPAQTPGISITLEPRRPASTWTAAIEGSSSFGDGLTAS